MATEECVTAVFIPGLQTDSKLEVAISEFGSDIKVERLLPDPNICALLRLVRVPALCVYNSAGEETARAYGNKHIEELVESVTA